MSVAQYVHGKPCSDSAPDREHSIRWPSMFMTVFCVHCQWPSMFTVSHVLCARSVAQYVHGKPCSDSVSGFTVSHVLCVRLTVFCQWRMAQYVHGKPCSVCTVSGPVCSR